jgi:HEXXH motif-containing protein
MIVNQQPAEQGIRITSLSDLNGDRDPETVTCYFCDDDSMFGYVGPDTQTAARTGEQLRAAIDDLCRFAPDLAAEMSELVTTVFLARGIPACEDAAGEFESVSALRAFGGVLFNAESMASRLQCAVSLIHEHAHVALFAISPKEGVVTNGRDERYTSPLRSEPRPVEGIFHQCFVLARMLYGMDLLRGSDRSDRDEVSFAEAFIAYNVPRFNDAVETLQQHAQFTPEGEAVFKASRAYVSNLS